MIGQQQISGRVSSMRTALLAFAALAIAATTTFTTHAAELAAQAQSLRKVPADAAFYTTSLRLKEQWDTFVGSNAYSKLMQIPLVQLGKMQAGFQWQQSSQPNVVQVREYLQSPAGQDAVNVLKEMFSDEIFAYGGSNIAESIKVFMDVNTIRRNARLQALAEGEDPESTANDKVFAALKDKLANGVKMPTFVLGFHIKDAARAKRELDEVHSLIRNALDEHLPEIAAHLQRDQIAGHEFLTLRLDGSMVPWEKVREEAAEKIDEEQFNAIREAFTKQTLAVALGIVDDYVVFSVSDSTDHLEKLGQGATLADQPAIKRLEKHADQRVVAVSYVSKAFAQSFGSPQTTLDDLAGSVEEGLVQAKVDEEDRKLILDDIRSFDLAKYMPEPADVSAIAFLTGRGYEAFQYSDAKRPMLDASKPLSILGHVGGNPLLLFASRSKQNVEDYNQLVTWLKKIAGHAETIAEKKADSDKWEKYKEVREQGVALLERLDQANRDQLFPALADGQGAFVMDIAATSKQWFEKMPESPKPLPMLELAMVTSVSDAEKLKQGATTYIEVAREAYKLAKELHPDETPTLKLPKPTISELSGGGTLFTYPLPEKWGVDSQVAVNAGLTSSFAAVSLMPKMTERLLQDKSAEIDTGFKLDQPAAIVTHVEFAKGIDVIRPWMDYGLDVALGKIKPVKEKKDDDSGDDSGDEDEDKPAQPSQAMLQMGFVVPQVHLFLDVAAALRSASSITYEEEGVWVTRSETHIQDLK